MSEVSAGPGAWYMLQPVTLGYGGGAIQANQGIAKAGHQNRSHLEALASTVSREMSASANRELLKPGVTTKVTQQGDSMRSECTVAGMPRAARSVQLTHPCAPAGD